MSKTFSSNKSSEQGRLKLEHPGEDDVVVCKRGDPKACYVKGNLMPSRAFGDLRLKHAEFNKHNWGPGMGYRNVIPTYTGPYVDYKPDIVVHQITKGDKYLVLASDGLWDEVKRRETTDVVEKGMSNEKLAIQLFDKAMQHIQETQGYSREYINQLADGSTKRQIVDDITILVMDLEK